MVQKKQEITYRELRKEDYRQIEKILGDTWGFSRRCKDQKVVRLLEKSYWASLLAQENFARVALINGKPVGVVLARKEGKGRKNFTMNFRGLFYGIRLGLSQEGRSNLKLFRELNRQNRQMFKEQGEKFDGELIYLNILRSKKEKVWELNSGKMRKHLSKKMEARISFSLQIQPVTINFMRKKDVRGSVPLRRLWI